MSAFAVSVLLSLISAVAYAGGAIVQERVAAGTPDGTYAPLRHPAWWAAIALNGLGALLHVVALAYGPLSLVQPLGALTIVFALPMAALFVGRRAGATAWRGALMATVGLAGLLALTGGAEAQSLDSTQRVLLATLTGGAVVALMTAARAAHRHPVVRSVLLAAASGIAFGIASVFTKTVAEDWERGLAVGSLPIVAVIAVLAAAGTLLSQASYRGAGLAAPLATVTVVNPVIAAAVGLTMFGETFRYGVTGTMLALGCGVVAAGGLILLTTERISGEQRGRTAPETVPAQPTEPAALPARPLPAVTGAGSPLSHLPAEGGTEAEALIPLIPVIPAPLTTPVRVAPVTAPVPVTSVAATSVAPTSVAATSVAAAADAATVPAAPASVAAALPASFRSPSQWTAAYTFGPFYSGPFIPTPLSAPPRSRVGS
ncbi:DMT family transporter [Streptomyces sp. ME02-6978a]|uniref:DMT family transporter n=1 Tax=unclassified Streptomyces TaxID=2593676 RepID=UPI0029BBF646|nr:MULTISPECIES: DMT family transporter [unclassified Streptomyces]MDX3092517.1 DMT family transporter [Streptomyces sp. ME12-02E]MDX3332363.1 DMT family transporter [Streptomyces sp. ME02-6978a]